MTVPVELPRPVATNALLSATGLQALIFDMDGVVCDTMPFHLQAWMKYVAQTPELAEIDRGCLAQMGGRRNRELLMELLNRPISEAEIHRWGSEKEAMYRSLIQDQIVWLPGLMAFLQQARSQGLRLGLGTSACRENVELLMSHEDLGTFFEVKIMELDVQRGKPDPQCYLLVADRLGVAPEQCLVFEDAIAGVQAARNAGMRAWGVLTSCSAAELQEVGAECCIRDFTDPLLSYLLQAS